jgi:hypothetical protein
MTRQTLVAAFALTGLACTGVVVTGDADAGSGGGTTTGGGGTAMDGGSATGGGGAIAGAPTWRQGLAKWQWVELPGSSLSAQQVPDPFTGALEAPAGRIDAWNGFAANQDTNRVYLACAGGHADWAGNEVYEIDLQSNQPKWRMLRGPTMGAAVVQYQSYYTDGRPSSTHLYYALHFVRSRGRIFKLSAGSLWGSGNENNSKVDAFSLAANDWDPIGTYAEGTPNGAAINRPYAQHPTTEDLYTYFSAYFWRWNAASATWEQLAPRPNYANDDLVYGSASAVDTVRQRVIFTRNVYKLTEQHGLSINVTGSPTLSEITFTGAAAAKLAEPQSGMDFVPSEDAFLLKNGTAGEVVRVNPTTFEVTVQTTTGPQPPDAVNGVFTRWQYLPKLKGFAYEPSASANFWFLATE